MEAFSAVVCSTQALVYSVTVVKSLTKLRNTLKHGGGFLRDEEASVNYLQEIITQFIPKEQTALDRGLESLLESINNTVESLLVLLDQQKPLSVVLLLVIRRAEVNESLALLERKKNTLTLYLAAQNSAAIASLSAGALLQPTQALEMPRHYKSQSEVFITAYDYFFTLTV